MPNMQCLFIHPFDFTTLNQLLNMEFSIVKVKTELHLGN